LSNRYCRLRPSQSLVCSLSATGQREALVQRIADLSEAVSTYLFDEFQKLASNGIDPAQQALGWKRFRPTEVLLARRAQQAEEQHAFEEFTGAQGVCPLPDAVARERLYKDFLAWRKIREQDPSSAGSASDKK
jgi:hypothetical protein